MDLLGWISEAVIRRSDVPRTRSAAGSQLDESASGDATVA